MNVDAVQHWQLHIFTIFSPIELQPRELYLLTAPCNKKTENNFKNIFTNVEGILFKTNFMEFREKL